MQFQKVKLGIAPTKRNLFNQDEALIQKNKIVDALHKFNVDFVDIEDICPDGFLFNESHIDQIISKFNQYKVEGVFFPHCNFGTEFAVAQLASKLNKPVLIWGSSGDEIGENGELLRTSQCGLFATGKVLNRMNVKFDYITTSEPTDEVFMRGFNNFISLCSVISQFNNLKILQVSTRPSPFWSVMFNESELLQKFGIKILPISMQDIVGGVGDLIAINKTDYSDILAEVYKKYVMNNIDKQYLQKIIALKLYLKNICEKERISAIAIQCWDSMQDALGIMPCVANAMLTDEYLPVTCETDINGAVSSVLIQAAARREKPVFFADITIRHPQNRNANLLWHCGNFPAALSKNSQQLKISKHYINLQQCPAVGEFELKHGDITVCRFDENEGQYSLFFGEGKGVPGPVVRGTFVWFEVDDWPKWEERLVKGPYIHHCAGVHKHVSAVLYSSCKYITNLMPDPFYPGKEQIESYLRGNE